MDRMDFLVPIYVGELVTFRATVNAAWRTLDGGRRPRRGREPAHRRGAPHQHRLPDHGRARRRRPAGAGARRSMAETPVEQRRMREAELRRANRLAERAEILARRAPGGASDRPPSRPDLQRSRYRLAGWRAWKPRVLRPSAGASAGRCRAAGCGSCLGRGVEADPGDLARTRGPGWCRR